MVCIRVPQTVLTLALDCPTITLQPLSHAKQLNIPLLRLESGKFKAAVMSSVAQHIPAQYLLFILPALLHPAWMIEGLTPPAAVADAGCVPAALDVAVHPLDLCC